MALTCGEKTVKRRPLKSNRNRIEPNPQAPEGAQEPSTLRIALKCLHTIFATALP